MINAITHQETRSRNPSRTLKRGGQEKLDGWLAGHAHVPPPPLLSLRRNFDFRNLAFVNLLTSVRTMLSYSFQVPSVFSLTPSTVTQLPSIRHAATKFLGNHAEMSALPYTAVDRSSITCTACGRVVVFMPYGATANGIQGQLIAIVSSSCWETTTPCADSTAVQ